MNLRPLKYNWPPVVHGDTYPAQNITESISTDTLESVLITIKHADGEVALSLDSDTSGVTITNGAAGSWDFTIDQISSSLTTSLGVGIFEYDLEITLGSGSVRTVFEGQWEIL